MQAVFPQQNAPYYFFQKMTFSDFRTVSLRAYNINIGWHSWVEALPQKKSRTSATQFIGMSKD